ncbi:hypothetical protein IAT38_003335 [Cryptococcus sp. DSM 104549]
MLAKLKLSDRHMMFGFGGLSGVLTLVLICLVIWLFAFHGQGHEGWWQPDPSDVTPAAASRSSKSASRTSTSYRAAKPTATASWDDGDDGDDSGGDTSSNSGSGGGDKYTDSMGYDTGAWNPDKWGWQNYEKREAAVEGCKRSWSKELCERVLKEKLG